jgi:hypothetical protein
MLNTYCFVLGVQEMQMKKQGMIIALVRPCSVIPIIHGLDEIRKNLE